MSKNHVQLKGNLARDPQVFGKSVRLTLAVAHAKRVGDCYLKTGTSFINLVAFNDTASEMAQYKKGDALTIACSNSAQFFIRISLGQVSKVLFCIDGDGEVCARFPRWTARAGRSRSAFIQVETGVVSQ